MKTFSSCALALFRCALVSAILVGANYASEPSSNQSIKNSAAGNQALLANPGLVNEPMRGTFFFPGEWIWGPPPNGPVGAFYGRHFESGEGNARFYTLHPKDARNLGWSESEANRLFAVNSMIDVGINTVVMSYWGPPGTDNWEYWAPMQDSPQAQEELFDAAVAVERTGKHISIMPSLEDGAGTFCVGGHSPQFRLADHLPFAVSQHGDDQAYAWVKDLVYRFIARPKNPAWREHFTQMYDRNGDPRYIINLKDVASTQPGATDANFAEGLNALATRVERDFQIKIGFTLDPRDTHEPAHNDPCVQRRPTTYLMSPESADRPNNPSALVWQPSVVAIQYYRSEIIVAGGGNDRNVEMIAYKRDILGRWQSHGIPVIADFSPGYDGHLVFKDAIYVYGSNDEWRNDLSQLRNGRIRGVTFNSWNGYTEGWAGMPTLESGRDGTAPFAMNNWIRELFTPDPRFCNHVHFVHGAPTYRIYGGICEKYYSLAGTRSGILGSPVGSEEAGCLSSRRNRFQYGVIVWPVAHEVHGAVGELYKTIGYECSWLGKPLTDELPSTAHCAGGRYNRFESGFIDWCPDGRLWAHRQ
jgi:hypothetical protein